jgi:hypothetical protein
MRESGRPGGKARSVTPSVLRPRSLIHLILSGQGEGLALPLSATLAEGAQLTRRD